MKRGHKLQLAKGRIRNAKTHLRLAGSHGEEDGRDAYDAMQCLDRALNLVEAMIERQATRDRAQG